MTLTVKNLKVNQAYRIKNILNPTDDISLRLMQLGFISGERITLIRKAPLFGEPLLVEVRGSQYAISKSEASLIELEEN